MEYMGVITNLLPSRELTYPQRHFWVDDFPFPRWDMLVPWRVSFYQHFQRDIQLGNNGTCQNGEQLLLLRCPLHWIDKVHDQRWCCVGPWLSCFHFCILVGTCALILGRFSYWKLDETSHKKWIFAGRCGSSCLVSASLTVSLKRTVCKKGSWKWKPGCNLKRTGSNLWVVSVNTIPFRFYQDAPLALLNLNVGKTREMKKLSTGNTGQNPPGLLKLFTGCLMFIFWNHTGLSSNHWCSTIGPSYPKQDVPWHQLDPKWDPENRWECASSIQTNPLNSLVNLEGYLIGWIQMWIPTETRICFFSAETRSYVDVETHPAKWMGVPRVPQCPVEVLILLIIGKRDTNRK